MKKFTLAFSLLLAGVSGAFAQEENPAVEPGTSESPALYAIGSYSRGGYLTELDEAYTGWYATSTLAHTELTESSLWDIYETGNGDGSVYIQNHATGKYLFSTGPVDVTETPTPVWVLANGVNNYGWAISNSSALSTCIDADNYDILCGTWYPSAGDWEGTTWVFTAYADENAANQAQNQLLIDNAIAELEAYKTSVPGCEYVVDARIEELNSITDFSTIQEQIDDIVARGKNAILLTATSKLGYRSAIINNRRATNDKPGYLYVTTVESTDADTAEVTYTNYGNTEEALSGTAIWCAVPANPDTYKLFNPASNLYVGSVNSGVDYGAVALVDNIDDAGEYEVRLCNGFVTFVDVNVDDDHLPALNLNTGTANLTYWSEADGGSYWCLEDIISVEDEDLTISFQGADDEGNAEFLSSFTIHVPDGAETTGYGYVTLYGGKVGTQLAQWDASSFHVDDNNGWTLAPVNAPIEDAGYYYVMVDDLFFIKDGQFIDGVFGGVTVSGSGDVDPENPTAGTFALTVTPAEGTVESIDTIHITSDESADFGLEWNNTHLVCTITKGEDVVETFDFNTVNAGDNWADDKADYVLTTSITEDGTYTFTIPAELFIGGANFDLYNEETIVVWTIEHSAIQSISVTANGQTKVVYDINGRRVANPTKGLYIVDGVKTILK